jgi:hypothetical protein
MLAISQPKPPQAAPAAASVSAATTKPAIGSDCSHACRQRLGHDKSCSLSVTPSAQRSMSPSRQGVYPHHLKDECKS